MVSCINQVNSQKFCNVDDFGAVGDGKTDNTNVSLIYDIYLTCHITSTDSLK